jgi:hypothetical protein
MPTELDRLFEQVTLVRPSDSQPNLVHLVRAIATTCGVDLPISPAVEELKHLIGPGDHLVFVLLDGLGINVARRLPGSSFISSHIHRKLAATFPSTTACALTAVATAEYPTRHGVVGWFVYLSRLELTATVLPFQERFSREPLVQRGIRPSDVLPLMPVAPRMKRKVITFTPAAIADTPYNNWSRGGTEGRGYLSIPQAVEQIIAAVRQATEPSYIHLYLPEIDTICHKFGVENPMIIPEVLKIDDQLRHLAQGIEGRARLIVTADHGLIDVPEGRQALLLQGDPLLELLVVPPTGDARMPIFHVREQKHEAFLRQARERFGDRMIFLPTAEAERMELYGPGMSEISRRRLGDFIGIAFEPATLAFHPDTKPPRHLFKAVHAGLSHDEMWVPLALA